MVAVRQPAAAAAHCFCLPTTQEQREQQEQRQQDRQLEEDQQQPLQGPSGDNFLQVRSRAAFREVGGAGAACNFDESFTMPNRTNYRGGQTKMRRGVTGQVWAAQDLVCHGGAGHGARWFTTVGVP